MMDAILGEIRAFAGNYAPQNWAICDGSTLQVDDYQALFSIIGTTYGGNGITTFKLPDLRGKLAIGQGYGTGLTPKQIGSFGGSETVVITEDQMPSHNHLVKVSTVPSSVKEPSNNTYLGAAVAASGVAEAYMPGNTTGIKKVTLDDSTIQDDGYNYPHLNIMPSVAVSYIMCIKNGVYPQRAK